MKLCAHELEFLAAWALEERTANPYSLPAHKLQAVHRVKGVTLICAIEGWARCEGRADEDIFCLCRNSNPAWAWSSEEEMAQRLAEIRQSA